MASPSVTARPVGRPAPDLHRRLLLSGILFGVGVAAFVDEVVLHQLLHWHHFYDLSTAAVGLVSDGLFHAFGWFAAVAGLFLFADVRRRGGPGVGRWWPAVLIGAGVPTRLAIAWAEAAGLTLIGRARGDGFDIFTHPQRIEG